MSERVEVCGVRLQDVFRDNNGDFWEVFGLVTEPQACVRRVMDGMTEQHVIGCLDWAAKFPDGALRRADSSGSRE